ncbi:MAG: ATP-binding cassette domain-containing protein [Desulfovibrionaceae bacterium]|nr:ATP-binding cassette domain-containing protein [Desulfovibrionaceae bacterium]
METPWDIRFSSLTLGYGTRVVLRDISGELPGGAISMILGESGCGKSTLLRHMIGLAKPMAGSLYIGGEDFFAKKGRDFRRLRRRMGVLFQDGALLGSLTIAENVALPLSEHLSLPSASIRREVLRVLSMVELADAADFYPNELSGGMRKRAGLARAIIANPSLLFCDEPTSGLDPVTAARMDALLLSLHGQFPQMTIVVVSHDLASLSRIADYTLVLRDGACVFSGTRDELFASKDPYLSAFLQRETEAEAADFSLPMDPSVSAALSRWLAQ